MLRDTQTHTSYVPTRAVDKKSRRKVDEKKVYETAMLNDPKTID